MGSMRLYHTTTVGRLESILAQGLLTAYSRGKLPAVWLHGTRLGPWACRHMMARPGVSVERLVRLTVDVPRTWLTRRGKGVYYCLRDIPAERILSVAYFGVTHEVSLKGGE